jgi:hypothetical protein
VLEDERVKPFITITSPFLVFGGPFATGASAPTSR